MRWIKGNVGCVNLEESIAFTIEKSEDDIAISAIVKCMPDSLIRIHNGFICEQEAMNWIHKKLNNG